MSLSWARLERITNSKKRQKPTEEVSAYSSNILLQITLPMVLILGFVVFTTIKYYKDEITKRPGWEQYDRAYLELQKQILMKTWENTKSERRTYFKIDLFLNKDVKIKEITDKFISNRSIDDDFKYMCEKTSKHLNNEIRCKKEINYLYGKVLENTSKELRKLETEKNLSFRGIKDENKQIIKKQIEEFINGFTEDVTKVQHKVIMEIFTYFKNRPAELKDEELNKLVKKFKNVSEGDKKNIFTNIYDRLCKKLKNDLEDMNYYFLEKTWQKIKI